MGLALMTVLSIKDNKGNDYKIQEVVGHNIIKRWGGKVVLIKCIRGKSTSNIIRKIKNVT